MGPGVLCGGDFCGTFGVGMGGGVGSSSTLCQGYIGGSELVIGWRAPGMFRTRATLSGWLELEWV